MARRNLFYLLLGATTGGAGGTDTSDATATESDIRLGKTAYGATGKMAGIIPDYDGATVPSSGKSLFTQLADGSITEVTASDLTGMTEVRDGAFKYCVDLTSITIPDSAKSISFEAFYNCTSITNITIGNGVKSIGEMAFYGCRNLASLTIGSGVTFFFTRAFKYCGQNTTDGVTITILATTPPTIQSGTFADSTINKIIVPKGLGDAYKAATNWSALADYIEEAVE